MLVAAMAVGVQAADALDCTNLDQSVHTAAFFSGWRGPCLLIFLTLLSILGLFLCRGLFNLHQKKEKKMKKI